MAGRAEVLLGNREELRKCTGGRMNRPEIGIPGWGEKGFWTSDFRSQTEELTRKGYSGRGGGHWR